MDVKQAIATLGVPMDVDEPTLRAQYKKLALELHPDKGRLDKVQANAVFATLTMAFKTVAEHIKNRGTNMNFQEMRAASRDSYSAPAVHPPVDNKFDLEKFNGVFDETKVNDYMDQGYDHWLKSSAAADSDHHDSAMVKYSEPQALVATTMTSTYEYGKGQVDDFSGENMSDRGLCYMDVRKAYSKPREIESKRKDYKNISELEQERADISYTMNKQDRDTYEAEKRRMEMTEHERLMRMQDMDRQHSDRFQRINQLMLPTR